MQLRTLLIASVVGLSFTCIAGFASAQQIYKWKDASGVTHFSQTPPATGTHYTKMRLANEPAVSANPPSTDEEDNAEAGDAGHRSQAAASAGSQPDTPSNRAELCKQLASNIALLSSKQPVVTGTGNGKPEVMGDNAREQQLATARAQQAQYCSGGG